MATDIIPMKTERSNVSRFRAAKSDILDSSGTSLPAINRAHLHRANLLLRNLHTWNVCSVLVIITKTRHLRSSERNLLLVPRHQLNMYSCWAFAVAGPPAQNSLLNPALNENTTKAAFSRLQKIFLFARYWLNQCSRVVFSGNALYKSTHWHWSRELTYQLL